MTTIKKNHIINNFFVLFIALVWLEVIARIFFIFDFRGFDTTRKYMTGEIVPFSTFERVTDQAYLLYIPTPNYKNKYGLQHNAQGYRGAPVNFVKKSKTIRIICMGGSTTYGWGVDKPEYTYPAYLQKLLNENRPEDINNIEVINAGIPSGTTAEILTHYLFKFSYYQPDIVIIDAGGNDARALYLPYYHPDYSHTRRKLHLPNKISLLGCQLLKSRLLSFVIIPIFYGPFPAGSFFYSYHTEPPPAFWYRNISGAHWKKEITSLPKEEIAFWHNTDILISQLKRNGVKVLLVPFRFNPIKPYEPSREISSMADMLKELAQVHNVLFAPFTSQVISKNNWIDDCHLTKEGNLEKARFLAPYVRRLLNDSNLGKQ